ncbi:MAG: sugar transferase [Actinomycetota bacterium]
MSFNLVPADVNRQASSGTIARKSGEGDGGQAARRLILSSADTEQSHESTAEIPAVYRSAITDFVRPRFGSPHRFASWVMAVFTLGLLGISALSWSTVLAGRWTILSGTSVLTTFLVLFSQGYFRVNMVNDGTVRLRLAGSASAIGVTAGLFVTSLPSLGQPRVPAFVSLMLVLLGAAATGRMMGRAMVRRLWRHGHLRANALVYGTNELAREMAIEINLRRNYGVDVVGFVSDGTQPATGSSLPAPVYAVDVDAVDIDAAVAKLADAQRRLAVDRLIVGPSTGGDEIAQQVARWAAAEGLPVHVVPRFYQMGMGLDSMSPDRVRGYPLVRLQRSAHPQLSIRLKRVLDVIVASTVLVAFAPVMAMAALAVKLTSSGPVLFSQDRVGQHGKPIVVRKFRSMTVSDESDTEWNAEARVTTVGKWLRRSNIDELPQLFTILAGDMSLVGPRPERPVFVERFRQKFPDYDDRHRMPVGLTGLAQVVGLRGDTSISERVKYDNLYIDQWSLRADLEILARTVVAVLRQKMVEREVVELERAMRGREMSSAHDQRSRRDRNA